MGTIVVTGPVSSGTRMLHKLVKSSQAACGDERELFHRSMPQWQDFWTWEEFPDDTLFVVMLRRPDYSTLSAFAAGHGLHIHERVGFNEWRAKAPLPPGSITHQDMLDWWDEAMAYLADFPSDRTHWVSYEAMVLKPDNQMRGVAAFLGLDDYRIPFPIVDANRKWKKIMPTAKGAVDVD